MRRNLRSASMTEIHGFERTVFGDRVHLGTTTLGSSVLIQRFQRRDKISLVVTQGSYRNPGLHDSHPVRMVAVPRCAHVRQPQDKVIDKVEGKVHGEWFFAEANALGP